MNKKLVISTIIALVIIITAVISIVVNNSDTSQTAIKLTPTEEDGYILFSYSYSDALKLNGESSNTITTQKSSDQIVYTFNEHVLSCGTHMNGSLKATKGTKATKIKGSFTVTNNSYKIDSLLVDIEIDTEDSKIISGSLTVNDKEIDIKRFYTSTLEGPNF